MRDARREAVRSAGSRRRMLGEDSAVEGAAVNWESTPVLRFLWIEFGYVLLRICRRRGVMVSIKYLVRIAQITVLFSARLNN